MIKLLFPLLVFNSAHPMPSEMNIADSSASAVVIQKSSNASSYVQGDNNSVRINSSTVSATRRSGASQVCVNNVCMEADKNQVLIHFDNGVRCLVTKEGKSSCERK